MPLSMGRMISSVQRNEMASKESYLAAGRDAGIIRWKSMFNYNCLLVCVCTT